MELDIASLPDGPIDPALGQSFGRGPGRVVGGAWTHNIGRWDGVAAYLQVETPEAVSLIECEAVFDGWGGAVALVAPTADWSTTSGWEAGVHFVASRTRWEVSYYGNESRTPMYARGLFLRPLRVGTAHTFRVERDGDMVTVTLPNGRAINHRDEHVARVANLATFELFTPRPSATSARITAMRAR